MLFRVLFLLLLPSIVLASGGKCSFTQSQRTSGSSTFIILNDAPGKTAEQYCQLVSDSLPLTLYAPCTGDTSSCSADKSPGVKTTEITTSCSDQPKGHKLTCNVAYDVNNAASRAVASPKNTAASFVPTFDGLYCIVTIRGAGEQVTYSVTLHVSGKNKMTCIVTFHQEMKSLGNQPAPEQCEAPSFSSSATSSTLILYCYQTGHGGQVTFSLAPVNKQGPVESSSSAFATKTSAMKYCAIIFIAAQVLISIIWILVWFCTKDPQKHRSSFTFLLGLIALAAIAIGTVIFLREIVAATQAGEELPIAVYMAGKCSHYNNNQAGCVASPGCAYGNDPDEGPLCNNKCLPEMCSEAVTAINNCRNVALSPNFSDLCSKSPFGGWLWYTVTVVLLSISLVLSVGLLIFLPLPRSVNENNGGSALLYLKRTVVVLIAIILASVVSASVQDGDEHEKQGQLSNIELLLVNSLSELGPIFYHRPNCMQAIISSVGCLLVASAFVLSNGFGNEAITSALVVWATLMFVVAHHWITGRVMLKRSGERSRQLVLALLLSILTVVLSFLVTIAVSWYASEGDVEFVEKWHTYFAIALVIWSFLDALFKVSKVLHDLDNDGAAANLSGEGGDKDEARPLLPVVNE